MSQPTTTAEAVIDDWITRLRNLDPTKLGNIRFDLVPDEAGVGLREYVENVGASALRRFQIESVGQRDEPGVIADEQRLERDVEILVAYPSRPLGLYGRARRRDLESVIDADGHSISSLITDPDLWLSGVNLQRPTVGEVDRGGLVWFLPIIVRVQWFAAR